MRLNRSGSPETIRDFRSSPSQYQRELDAMREEEGHALYAIALLSLLVAVVIASAVLG
tara:strand:+ start:255 stop:428 length:174 start_codon:yes stop_codon:yes gene_type:complete